jgi:hypothetical protein
MANVIQSLWMEHKATFSRVEVGNETGSASIRVRSSCVYTFAEDIYRKLMAAFKANDMEGLNKLWSRATPFA